ncbi:hypothetical protein HWV62_2719 [Athelia sp. TMB]|nr:hypothetical protein HWV62_2719 [Athelia sp. TMB]
MNSPFTPHAETVPGLALKKLDHDFWIELESTYRERIVQRQELYAKHGSKIIVALPGSQFHFNKRTAIFHNAILGTSANIRTTEPWQFLLNNVPEDFTIIQLHPKTGLPTFTAGIACAAVGWNVATKIGKPLHEIHESVPDYQKMKMSMDRYFTKVTPDKPIQRGSWGIEVGQPLFVQPDDPHFALRRHQDPNLAIDDLYLHVNWQILRRLPRSQAVAFNYKALFTPVTEFRDEPYIPKLVATLMKEGKPSIMDYKATYHVEHVALPAFEQWAKEQEEKGLVPPKWNPRTLDEDPFFPGWHAKWNLSNTG